MALYGPVTCNGIHCGASGISSSTRNHPIPASFSRLDSWVGLKKLFKRRKSVITARQKAKVLETSLINGIWLLSTTHDWAEMCRVFEQVYWVSTALVDDHP